MSQESEMGISTSETSSECKNINSHVGFPDSCSYVRANQQCEPGARIKYVEFFYCTCSHFPSLAYAIFLVWLAVLFYMLGNTAADYFCCTLEKLSKLLHLPPTVAGVTLLPLGNGAPDVFASIASFMGIGHGQVGLNSSLGGAMFVTSIVAGSVGLLVSSSQQGRSICLDRKCFLRDVGFFMVTLVSLCLILAVGKIHLWGAIAYLSIYIVYSFVVATGEYLRARTQKKLQLSYALEPLLASSFQDSDDEPGLAGMLDPGQETMLPQWMWISNVAIYSHKGLASLEQSSRPLWGWSEQEEAELQAQRSLLRRCWQLLQIPITLPRRLTIPMVEDSRWSRFFAVASVTLSPTLLAAIWNSDDGHDLASDTQLYMLAGTVGIVLGILAFSTTKVEQPPSRFLFPWVAGGFIMSIAWFYIIANELVAALVALGEILEFDPAILGLTVLAWGNSMGDLVSNLALACSSSGNDGVQIAISGCYAGPMFNTLIGLGLSFLLTSWRSYPSAFEIPTDPTLFYTLGFLYATLLWALIVLPASRMRPSKGFGIGLFLLYGLFLSLRLAHVIGAIWLPGLRPYSEASLGS
ncbi:unnamed protein product [Sphagnum jensenii]|uniref:Sodium/calcium exchanger membrane region domain-containing protein n=1 Tax=Sphagnum jensenii TaxID=128206 RepID=A0ABP0VLF4_9BRYO